MNRSPHGRSGPARCAECDTPLGPDDDQLAKLCRECRDMQIPHEEMRTAHREETWNTKANIVLMKRG
jgi:hypothetical protein